MTWIFLWDTAPSKIFVWDSEVSSVWVWDTKVRPTEITDIITTNAYTNNHSNHTYYYGVKFTALKSWTITKVGFYTWDSFSWSLKIGKWNYYAGMTDTATFSLSWVNWEYTLGTPYSITAGNGYVVCFQNNWYNYYPTSVSYPSTWDAVQYDYGIISSWSSQQTTIWNIVSLTIKPS